MSELVPDGDLIDVMGIWASVHATDAAAFDQRLNALAATVCDADPRTKERRRADATGALARGEAQLACQCGSDDCAAAAERNAASAAVIHVLAERATVDGTSDHPGYLAGVWGTAARVGARARHHREAQAASHSVGCAGSGISALDCDGGVCALAGLDVPLARL